MIISASRRTDIPAFYGEWFMNRVRAGYCLVANPFNNNQVSWIPLTAQAVDAVVFWTKNPRPFLRYLDELDRRGFRYMFMFTLNNYPGYLEPGVPPPAERISVFHALAERLGAGRVVWRYDPIIISNALTCGYHLENFQRLAAALEGATRRVIVSFVDFYRKTERRLQVIEKEQGEKFQRLPLTVPEVEALIAGLAEAGRGHGMTIQSCAEPEQLLERLGLPRGKCIDETLLFRELGVRVRGTKDLGQRNECLCVRSRDIGMVDTCLHGCAYCYAGSPFAAARWNGTLDRADSTILAGAADVKQHGVELRKAQHFVTPRRGP